MSSFSQYSKAPERRLQLVSGSGADFSGRESLTHPATCGCLVCENKFPARAELKEAAVSWGSCGDGLATVGPGEHTVEGLTLSPDNERSCAPVVTGSLPAGKTSGLSTETLGGTQCETGAPVIAHIESPSLDARVFSRTEGPRIVALARDFDVEKKLYEFAEFQTSGRDALREDNKVYFMIAGGFALVVVLFWKYWAWWPLR